MAEEINTGGGAAVGGGVGTGGGNFAGRDHNDGDANANVSVYFQNPPPQEERRNLSVTAEESLRIEIRELRSAITNLTDSVSKLDKTVALSGAESETVKSEVKMMSVEIKSADVRLTAMESIVKHMEKPVPVIDTKMLRNIFYALVGVIGLLVIIAYLLSGGGALN